MGTYVSLVKSDHLTGGITCTAHDALLGVSKRLDLLGAHAELLLWNVIRGNQPRLNTLVLLPKSRPIHNQVFDDRLVG